ncbi:MAG: SET domain-containing protein [Flavisolibacter sp.]
MKELIEIRDSRFGKGLFAKKKIPAGSVVCKITFNRRLDFKSTVELKEESHALQIDFGKYILCEPPFLYSNHSCNPNCGINSNFEMVTLKNIKPGEELFWDYSTSMLERHWTMRCACGEKNCRKIITDFDLVPQKIQMKYLELQIVFPFIAHFLQQQLAQSA